MDQIIRFSKKLLLILLVIFVCDSAIGYLLEHEYYKQHHGDDHVSIYTLEESDDDILIMGGSRASHHYVTDSISSTTGMSCFNAGRDEMTILYINEILPIIYKRYTPKVIVVDILPTELDDVHYDMTTRQRISSVLLPFLFRHPELGEYIYSVDKMERLKVTASKIYPYNSLAATIFQNAYTNIGHKSIRGYEPLTGHIDSAIYKQSVWGDFIKEESVNPQLVSVLKNIIKLTQEHNTKLIFSISPFYFPMDIAANNSYKRIKQIAEENNIPLFNFTNKPEFSLHPDLFNDDIHLNNTGAVMFTKDFVSVINKDQ